VGTATGADIQGVLEKAIESYRRPNANVQSAAALSAERSVLSNGGRSIRHLPIDPTFEFALTSERVRQANTALRRDVGESPDSHQNTVEPEATIPTSDMVTPPVAVLASAAYGVAS